MTKDFYIEFLKDTANNFAYLSQKEILELSKIDESIFISVLEKILISNQTIDVVNQMIQDSIINKDYEVQKREIFTSYF